ncbi:MAG TPA: FGGY-family carbohydrate kinase [Polyangiaceae bacterium]|nr:FGGY-family carbohydrate kinase [Polyangiaceae bacterium]
MTTSSHVLAIDLGTSGAKAAVFSATGDVLAQGFHPTRLRLLPGGGAEQDPAEWWQALVRATAQCLSAGIDRDSVRAIGVTGQWSGTVAVGADGEPLHPALIWMDSRGAPQIEEIAGGAFGLLPYDIARAARWIRLTGGAPGKSGKDSLAHILYLREHAPEVYARTRLFLEPKDYINYRLTGVAAATFDSIALHWVTDNRAIDAVEYHPTLLGYAGLDRAQLPPLCRASSVLGPLRPEVAAELGLSRDVRVVAGTPDIHGTALGSGAVRDHAAHLYLGTSTWLSCHMPVKKTDVLHNMASLPSALPGRYLLVNEQECAGACLTQLKDKILFGENDGAGASFSDLDALAAAAPAGSDKLIFLPWLYGERSPVEERLLRGGFFNYSLATTRAHLVRSVLEGIALNARWLLGYTERFVGRRFDVLRLVGGGAQSRLWCQIYADVLERNVEQIEAPSLASLRGAAALAFTGIEGGAPDEFAARVPVKEVFSPRRELRALYDELFGAFLGYYENNRRSLARLNAQNGARHAGGAGGHG